MYATTAIVWAIIFVHTNFLVRRPTLFFCTLHSLVLPILILVFATLTLQHSNAQTIDQIADTIKNIEQSFSSVTHHALMSANSSLPYSLAMQKFTSLELQFAFSTSNLANISNMLNSNKLLGDVLASESIYPGIFLGVRVKQWKQPFNVGFSFFSIGYNNKTKILELTVFNIATQVQYILLRSQSKFIPTVSLGLIYGYAYFDFRYVLNNIEFDGIDKIDSNVHIRIEAPKLTLNVNTHSIATRVQASKQFLNKAKWLEPFVGLEPALYISVINTNTDSNVYRSIDKGATYTKQTTFSELTHNFLVTKYLIFNQTRVNFALRLYGGVTFKIPIKRTFMYFDFQLAYEPISHITTFQQGIRMQF